MSKAIVATLFDLQELDLELDRLEGERETLRRRQDEDATKSEREAALRARKRGERARDEARTAEAALHEAEARIQKQEQRLYGGGTGARDLSALQTELTHLKAAHTDQEERVLALMLAADDADTAARAAVAALRQAERDWEAQRAQIGTRLAQEATQVDDLRARRARQAATIDAEALRRYDTIRRTHGGRAVALVQANTCQACHMAVTSSALQRARSGTEMIPCGNCGRILFVR